MGSFYALDAPVKRIGAMHVPVPFSPHLEDATIPSEQQVFEAARAMCKRSEKIFVTQNSVCGQLGLAKSKEHRLKPVLLEISRQEASHGTTDLWLDSG